MTATYGRLTGQKSTKKSKRGRFQILEVVGMMKPITKFARQIVNVGTIPSLVHEAFRLAEEERPGAVLLELPEDIAEVTPAVHLFPVNPPRRPPAAVTSRRPS